MRGVRLLVVDDNPDICLIVNRAFAPLGAEVIEAANGREALRAVYSQRPDLIILDVMLPDIDGWEVIRRVHDLTVTPIIVLTALVTEEDEIRGLSYGATDFIRKPFSVDVLRERVRAALRQAGREPDSPQHVAYEDDYLSIDLARHRVLAGGEPVRLSATEQKLLACLVENAGFVVPKGRILSRVWGDGYEENAAYVRVYIASLRRKLEPDPRHPRYILTEYGVGYRFERFPDVS